MKPFVQDSSPLHLRRIGATPFVEQARALKAAACRARTPAELLDMVDIQSALLTAAGVSDKAASHLQDTDKREAITGLIKNFLDPSGSGFVEEVVFRFLLTRGDTLGGSMRNVAGVMAQQKLTRSIIAHLKNAGKTYLWLHSQTGQWIAAPEDEAAVELQLRGISWLTGKKVHLSHQCGPLHIRLCSRDVYAADAQVAIILSYVG